MPTQRTIENAYQMLPYLVHYARRGDTVTYGDIARLSGLTHHRPVSGILGYIRDEICLPRNLPRITAIVVNKDTGMPGESFLEDGTSHLSKEQYKARFEKEKSRVFAYPHWEELLEELGLPTISLTSANMDSHGNDENEVIEGIDDQDPHAPSDYGLYKCQACGKMVMGYELKNHETEKHSRKKVEWQKMR